MLKVFALIKRLPTLDREAFRAHYEERHVAVARPLLRHLVRYARHHVVEELTGPVDFDVLTSFGYPNAEAVAGMFATLASEEALPILEDERRFMDKPANRFFEVSEHALAGSVPGLLPGGVAEEETYSVFVLVDRPPAMTRAECSARLLRDHWPALLASARAPRAVRLCDAFPMREIEPPCVGLIQLADAEGIDLERFAAGLRRDGYRVTAVRTRRYATALMDRSAPVDRTAGSGRRPSAG